MHTLAPTTPIALAPFQVAIPQPELDDLRRRLAATRLPADVAPLPDRDAGVAPGLMRSLLDRWQSGWDWRTQEAALNRWPQVIATIDGTPIHVIHVRSTREDAIPLVLTHGWPGTGFDFVEVIDRLTAPATPGPAFHLVIPTIPGFGFSTPLRDPGWDPARIARAWLALMDAFGYDRFAVHGGDWGTPISLALGALAPERVIGVHLSYLGTRADPADPDLTAEDRQRLEETAAYVANPAGYWVMQSTRPLTLAYALADSPAGQLAWIADRILAWMDPASPLDVDRLLTTATIFWLRNTADASSRLHFLAAGARGGGPAPCPVPVGIAVSPHDIVRPSRTVAARTYDIVHWMEFPRGGHFSAMETPDLLSDAIRAFVSSAALRG